VKENRTASTTNLMRVCRQSAWCRAANGA